MGTRKGLGGRLSEELEALRHQIAQLQTIVIEPTAREAPLPPHSPPAKPGRTSEQITSEIIDRLGFVPPFFSPAIETPALLEGLWRQMRAAYLDSDLPEIFKEKLLARLSRFCLSPYAVIAHSCMLHRLGMHGTTILEWLEKPIPDSEDGLKPAFSLMGTGERPLTQWPKIASPIDNAVLACASFIFARTPMVKRCQEELREFLGTHYYAHLISFLAYIRSEHIWLEGWPEPLHENDERIRSNLGSLLAEEPRLSSFFKNYLEVSAIARAIGLPKEDADAGLKIPALLDDGPFGMALMDSRFRILGVNRTLCRMLGYSEEELTSLGLSDITSEEDSRSATRLVEEVLGNALPQATTEIRLIRRNRDAFRIQLSVSVIQGKGADPVCGLIVVEDISEEGLRGRKEALKSLGRAEEFSERLINSSLDGIFAFDKEGILTICNPGIESIFGIRHTDVLGRHALEAFPFLRKTGDDKNLLETLDGKSFVTQDTPYSVPATGKKGFFEGHYSPIYDGESIVGGLAILRDITERKTAEETKRSLEEGYRDLFENASDMVYAHDLSGNMRALNKAAERITGYTQAEALQMNLAQLVAPESMDVARRMIDRQISGEIPPAYELEIVTKGGNRIALEVSTRPVFREGKAVAVQGIARDITDRKKTEDALQQAKLKLEAWVNELQQRTREMTLLSEMGDMLRACLTTEEAYNVTVRVAQQIFPVQTGALYVIAPTRNVVEAVAVWGETSLAKRVFSPDECWALRRGRVHWVEDTGAGLLCSHLHVPPPLGYLCVPMMAQSEALGVLHLTRPENETVPEARQRLAVAMAEHIAMALSNLKLHETLRSQSIRDPVTRLFNRSFMEETLELELRRAARKHGHLGIIMIDIDRFKEFSQAYGSDAGDAVIQDIGTLIQANVRKEDIACRLGGQIFAVLLPQGNIEITQQRAETLREMIMNLDLKHRSQTMGRVTVSLGAAGFPDHGRTAEALLKASESALRRSREEGGNRVVTAR